MKKYLGLFKYEMKTLFKDSLSLFIMIYPLLMLSVCGFLLPAILEKTTSPDSNATTITLLIGFVTILSLGGYIMGTMLGFSLLENKDENTLLSIAASPITVSGYAAFKIIYTFILAVFGNLIMIGGLKLIASDSYQVVYNTVTIGLLDNINWGHILVFSIVSSMIVPTVALLVASIAKNKIEGFAFMKSGGLVIMIPLLTLLEAFQDAKQYILGLAPNFWPIKPLLNVALSSTDSSNINFFLYMLIGALYMIGLSFLTYRLFIKKANIK